MRKRKAFFLTVSLGAVLVWIPQVGAKSTYLNQFNSTYGTSGTALNTCTLCHPGGRTSQLNSFAQDFLGQNHAFTASLEQKDSDGDGYSNLAEIQARTFPGDASSKPASDTTPPVVTSFSLPSTSSSLTVPISSFAATDNVGVTGYALSESSSAPASGWSASAPASYTFSSAGSKTLYAWARDAAGNVSSPKSAQVNITLNPIPPPDPEPAPAPGEGAEDWVDRWIRVTVFLKKGHDWSELGLEGDERKLSCYLHLAAWDSQGQVLSGLLYLEPEAQEEEGKALLVLPLEFLVISADQKEFWATSQFTEDPSTSFTARFKGKLLKGELKPGIVHSKHKGEGDREAERWFWLKGKLIPESQVPEEILAVSTAQEPFPMNQGGNFD